MATALLAKGRNRLEERAAVFVTKQERTQKKMVDGVRTRVNNFQVEPRKSVEENGSITSPLVYNKESLRRVADVLSFSSENNTTHSLLFSFLLHFYSSSSVLFFRLFHSFYFTTV